jgi:hypothetical protein
LPRIIVEVDAFVRGLHAAAVLDVAARVAMLGIPPSSGVLAAALGRPPWAPAPEDAAAARSERS